MDRVELVVDESPTALIEISPWSAEGVPAPFESLIAVITNRSDRHIVGIAAYWVLTDPSGWEQRSVFLSDSFQVPNFSPIAAPLARCMLGPDGVTPESVILAALDHTGGWIGSASPPLPAGTKARLTVDAVLFGDGEMVGPDASGLAAHIENRKPAATAVVEAVREAQAQGQSVTEALARMANLATRSPEKLSAFNERRGIAGMAMHHARDSARFEGYLQSLDALPSPVKIFRTA
jgi:hypothetical protein